MGEHSLGNKLYIFLTFVATIMIGLNVYTIADQISWNRENYMAYLFFPILSIYFGLIYIVGK